MTANLFESLVTLGAEVWIWVLDVPSDLNLLLKQGSFCFSSRSLILVGYANTNLKFQLSQGWGRRIASGSWRPACVTKQNTLSNTQVSHSTKQTSKQTNNPKSTNQSNNQINKWITHQPNNQPINQLTNQIYSYQHAWSLYFPHLIPTRIIFFILKLLVDTVRETGGP